MSRSAPARLVDRPGPRDRGQRALHRGSRPSWWVALRRGELIEAEADARTALAAAELPAPAFYRVLNGGVLIDALVEQGALAAAEEALAPMDEEAESGLADGRRVAIRARRLRVAQGAVRDGLEDLLEVGKLTDRALVTCPSFLPWRSEAAIASLRSMSRGGEAPRRRGARARARRSPRRERWAWPCAERAWCEAVAPERR